MGDLDAWKAAGSAVGQRARMRGDQFESGDLGAAAHMMDSSVATGRSVGRRVGESLSTPTPIRRESSSGRGAPWAERKPAVAQGSVRCFLSFRPKGKRAQTEHRKLTRGISGGLAAPSSLSVDARAKNAKDDVATPAEQLTPQALPLSSNVYHAFVCPARKTSRRRTAPRAALTIMPQTCTTLFTHQRVLHTCIFIYYITAIISWNRFNALCPLPTTRNLFISSAVLFNSDAIIYSNRGTSSRTSRRYYFSLVSGYIFVQTRCVGFSQNALLIAPFRIYDE